MTPKCSQTGTDYGGPPVPLKESDHDGYIRPWHLWLRMDDHWEVRVLVLCDRCRSRMAIRGFDLRPISEPVK